MIAIAVMERALITRDFSLAYIQQVGLARHAGAVQRHRPVERAGGQHLAVVADPGDLHGRDHAPQPPAARRSAGGLGAGGDVRRHARSSSCCRSGRSTRSKPARRPTSTAAASGPIRCLQNHILVLFHPPILYLGFVGFTVPFAFAIAALITGRVGEGWLSATRRWALYAWGFLTVGICWADGGATRCLAGEACGAGTRSRTQASCRGSRAPRTSTRCSCKSAAGCCGCGTSVCWWPRSRLTILGTFITRSGVLQSVHAFSNGTIGPYLLGFFGVIVVVSLSLIAWRGDRLRSPGAIDSPISREGAFLANNVIFTVFAFIVLLGTVFPLIVEALQDRQIAVGAPFFDRLSMPIGITLLFLMAVAPVLPWRKASTELLRDRLFWPAWCGAGALAISVVVGANGLAPLLAFFLGGFAGGAALRQLVLASRRQGWRGLVGRANGGMVVHLGVIIIAVALAASNSYTTSRRVHLEAGRAGFVRRAHVRARQAATVHRCRARRA